MLSVRRVLVALACVHSILAIPTHPHKDEATNWEKFSTLLDTVDEDALHQVLHAVYPKFRDGVFHRDRTAVEQVHSENPIMASKLVHIAKRQSNNGTITSSTSSLSSSSTEPPVVPPSTPASTSPAPDPSTDAEASSSQDAAISSALSSVLSNEITATSVPAPTTVFIVPSTPASATPIRTDSEGIVFSSSGGLLTLTSSAVNVRFTPVTATRTFYTTLSDGLVQTTTSVVVVNAPVTEAAGGEPTETAGLQNSAVRAATGGLTGFVIGAVGVLLAL